eukprot:gene17229-biopygen21859
MGPEVGPAFQRRSRDTPSSNIGVRLAETVSRHSRESARILGPTVRKNASFGRALGLTGSPEGTENTVFCGHPCVPSMGPLWTE